MKCNNCNRRHCAGMNNLQEAKTCNKHTFPKRGNQMIDVLSDRDLITLHLKYQELIGKKRGIINRIVTPQMEAL